MAPRPKPSSAPSDGDTLRSILGQLQELSRLVAEISARLAAQAAGGLDPGRPHDPGDAVPPGVAPAEPAPLTAEDKKARRALERLPARPGSRGRRA